MEWIKHNHNIFENITALWRTDMVNVPSAISAYCVSRLSRLWVGTAQLIQEFARGWIARWSKPDKGEIFRIRPDRQWGPASLLHNGYRVSFLGGRAAGAWRWPPNSTLAPRLKKESNCTSTVGVSLHGLFWGESYLYLYILESPQSRCVFLCHF